MEDNLAVHLSVISWYSIIAILFRDLGSLIFLDEFYQLLNDLVICLLRCAVIWPGEVVQLDDLSYFSVHGLVVYFQLSPDQVLHQTFAGNENELHLVIVLGKYDAFTYF